VKGAAGGFGDLLGVGLALANMGVPFDRGFFIVDLR
jgi:hypothetical protein